ncbi:hypothetical protein IFR05_017152, partial [Cadophora sp. M221]
RDREELRVVREEEGRKLAREWGCGFAEVEVESGCQDANAVIDTLVKEIRERRRKRGETEKVEKEGAGIGNGNGQEGGTGFWERILRR